MSILTADQLLDRMLKFANSRECPPDRKIDVENAAWKTWADSQDEFEPFRYDKVKNEAIRCIEGVPILGYAIKYTKNRKKRTLEELIKLRNLNN